jgi:hypothetical protein
MMVCAKSHFAASLWNHGELAAGQVVIRIFL